MASGGDTPLLMAVLLAMEKPSPPGCVEDPAEGAGAAQLKDHERQVTDTTKASYISRNCTEESDTTDASTGAVTSCNAQRCDISDDDEVDEAEDEVSPRDRTPRTSDDNLLSQASVVPWDRSRYEMLRILRPSSQSWRCQIELYRDIVSDRTVTVKRFPRICAQSLLDECGDAREDLDTGDLLLVCQQELETSLFDHCMCLGPPGLERQAKALAILRSLVKTTMTLHDVGITHGRIRAESTWLKRGADGSFEVVLTDFAGSKPCHLPDDGCKDAMYHAPELTVLGTIPKRAEAADLFACGVLGYALAVGRYPWLSTVSGQCKAFSFAQCHGIQSFLGTSRCPASKEGCMSSEYRALLDSLLDVDPCTRLEKAAVIHSSLLE